MSASKEIARLNKEAWDIRVKDREGAAKLARKALEMSLAAKDRNGEVLARLTLADRCSFSMELESAEKELDAVDSLLRTDTPRHTVIRYKHQRCYLNFQRGDFSKVIASGQDMLDHIKGRGHGDSRAWALQTMGIAYQRLGDPYRALTSYRDAEILMVKWGDKRHIFSIRMCIGSALAELGKEEEALEMFQDSLYLCLSIGTTFQTGLIIGNIAKTLQKLGEQAKALPRWDEAVTYFKEAGGMPHWAEALAGKADTLRAMNRLEEAESQLHEAIAGADTLPAPLRINLHLSLSRVYADAQRWEESLHSLRTAESLMTASTDHTRLVELHSGYHLAHKGMGDTASALHHHEQLLTHRDKSLNELSKSRLAEWEALYQVDRHREQTETLTRENQDLRVALSEVRANYTRLQTNAERCVRLVHEMFGHIPAQHKGRFKKLMLAAERPFSDTDADSTARTRISKAHPTLTPAELRVCGMVALGWVGKEIADRLGITIKGVDKHRSAIRKKLELPKSVSLQVYLEELVKRV